MTLPSREVNKRLNKYKKYNTDQTVGQILNRYNRHREKHKLRTRMRTHGWEELNIRGHNDGLEHKNKDQ